MAIVILCQSDLDLAHEHTMTFNNREEQFNYLRGDYFKTFRQMNIPVDGDREYFEIDMNINEVIEYDYCIITDGLGDTYYYFIVDMEQKGMITNIYVQVDLIQSYLFDWEIRDSFIDRMHVNRWRKNGLPTPNYEDEGLDYGTSIIEEIDKIIDIPLNYVICATTPIGKIEIDNGGDGGDGGGTGPSTGDWKNGIMSKNMFRFIKGYEGYAPNLYYDSGGVPTIGYGITNSEPTSFNKLKSNQPCSEELCAKELWAIAPKRYGKPIVNAVKNAGCTKQQQFDALVDLAYNAGTGRVTNTDSTLMKAIKRNPNDESYIRPIWEKYIIKDAAGNVLEGLKLRRKAECDVYFKGKYEKRKIPKLGSGGNITGSFEGDGWLP